MEQLKNHFDSARESAPALLNFTLNAMAALIILIIGWTVARWLRRRLRGAKYGLSRIDPVLRPVIASSVFYLVLAMTLYAVLTKIGIPATSLLAVFGAAGLAIGLALKDTLSNIASGVMLLILRPLTVGEYIDTDVASGSVQEIGLFATTLRSSEGLFVYVPNSHIWNSRIKNYSRHPDRRFVETIGVGYEADLKKAQNVLLKVMQQTADVLDSPSPPQCFVADFKDSDIELSCRCWLPSDGWSQRASDLRIEMKAALDKAKIDIPYPQRVIINKSIN